MKCIYIGIAIFLANITLASAQIVPPNWVSDKLLEQAESPIQKQLDTGVAMNATAEDMAAVRDARLLVIYLQLFEHLDKNGQAKLYHEQDMWLHKRDVALEKLQDPTGGSDTMLNIALKQLELTDQRINELSDRLKKVQASAAK